MASRQTPDRRTQGQEVIQAVATVLDFAPDHWNSGTRMVAIALADRVNQDGQCWPSVADIARRTGLSARMVKYHLRYLEDEGIITRNGQRIGTSGQPVSNLWTWRFWRIGGVQPIAPPGVQPTSPLPRGRGVQPIAPKPSLLTTRDNRYREVGT
jgi:DNA-binding transcriptional ArsR family regulator